MSYDPLQYSITNIGQSEGLSNMVINQLVPYKGNILAATSNGIYEIENPDQFIHQSKSAIPFYITNIQTYKGDTTNVSSLSIPFLKNKLKIQYNGISFQSAKEIIYQYRFRNADTIWNSTTSEELLLENLSAGEYALELRAIIPNKQRFSEIQSLQIIVEKPWWQKIWFLLLTAFFLGGLLYLLYRNRVNMIKRKANEKIELSKKMNELEQMALRSQMNPHFIFNCLTSIQQLIVSGNSIDANEYLVKFARLMRKTLENASHSSINLENEKAFLEEYVELEQLRVPEQFSFHISFENIAHPNLIEIPNMIIQPLLENSIRHGIMPLLNKKGKITIQFLQESEWIKCTIQDNGVGYDPDVVVVSSIFTKHKSYGKDIVRKRLQLLHDGKTQEKTLTINLLKNEDGSNAGTIATLFLPFQNKPL